MKRSITFLDSFNEKEITLAFIEWEPAFDILIGEEYVRFNLPEFGEFLDEATKFYNSVKDNNILTKNN